MIMMLETNIMDLIGGLFQNTSEQINSQNLIRDNTDTVRRE